MTAKHPMGDGEKASLRLQFNPKVRLAFHGATITTDAGLLAFREFDDALGLTEIAEDYLQESRTGRNILHHLVPLLRQSIYSRLAGYDDTNDAVRLSQDPAMRVIVGWQGSERKGASTSEMGRFETEFLTQEDNRQALARMNTRWVERAMAHTLHQRVILDMDSSESPVHGQQEGAAAKLRSGNVHSADDWQEVLDPVVERYFTAAVRLLFRRLVEAGVDVDAKAAGGESILNNAVIRAGPEIVQVLVDGGANVNAEDNLGRSVLYEAAEFDPDPEIVQILVVAGADVNFKYDDGGPILRSILYEAARNSDPNPEVVRVLVDAGADVNEIIYEGRSILYDIVTDSRGQSRSGADFGGGWHRR